MYMLKTIKYYELIPFECKIYKINDIRFLIKLFLNIPIYNSINQNGITVLESLLINSKYVNAL